MPELPEVEIAARRLRAAIVGRTIRRARVLHPALRRKLSPARARTLVGATVVDVERKGKHQLLRFDDGRVLHAHFRMSGDWTVARPGAERPRFARADLELDDGSVIVLDDPRALSTLTLHRTRDDALPALGPDATDDAFDEEHLARVLAKRRGPIKPALLDQRVAAGVGNIYAAEALWLAKIDPRVAAQSFNRRSLKTLAASIRKTLTKALEGHRRHRAGARFEVYDREGLPCRRCGSSIERMVQAGRSTYFCPSCQKS